MTSSNNWTDILEVLKNKNSNTYSEGKLIKMAITEIERLRKEVTLLEHRYQELSSKMIEHSKIKGIGHKND